MGSLRRFSLSDDLTETGARKLRTRGEIILDSKALSFQVVGAITNSRYRGKEGQKIVDILYII